ncbi:MAG: hypothetical protein ACYCZY_12105 [Lacisediminihabitans sp.]
MRQNIDSSQFMMAMCRRPSARNAEAMPSAIMSLEGPLTTRTADDARHAEKHTHDYFQHGTTSLFAAFNIADGTVISSNHRRFHVHFTPTGSSWLRAQQHLHPHRRQPTRGPVLHQGPQSSPATTPGHRCPASTGPTAPSLTRPSTKHIDNYINDAHMEKAT